MDGYQYNGYLINTEESQTIFLKIPYFWLEWFVFFPKLRLVKYMLMKNNYIQNSLQNMPKTIDFPQSLKDKIEQIQKKRNFPSNMFQETARVITKRPLGPLKEMIQPCDDIINCLKWLILLHNIIRYDKKDRSQEIIVFVNLVQLKNKKNLTSHQQVLLDKLIVPYKNYLLKRNLYKENQIALEYEQYVIINLMKKALKFVNIIFTLGRYYYRKYPFLSEFNIILAKDMSDLYRKLRFKVTAQFCIENVQVLDSLHQSLFIVYYNCYFSNYVVQFAPFWINTEEFSRKVEETEKLKKKKSETKIVLKEEKLGEEEDSHNLSICLEVNECSSCLQNVKTASTINTKNDIKEEMSEKEIKQRLDFIAEASSLLGIVVEGTQIHEESSILSFL